MKEDMSEDNDKDSKSKREAWLHVCYVAQIIIVMSPGIG